MKSCVFDKQEANELSENNDQRYDEEIRNLWKANRGVNEDISEIRIDLAKLRTFVGVDGNGILSRIDYLEQRGEAMDKHMSLGYKECPVQSDLLEHIAIHNKKSDTVLQAKHFYIAQTITIVAIVVSAVFK